MKNLVVLVCVASLVVIAVNVKIIKFYLLYNVKQSYNIYKFNNFFFYREQLVVRVLQELQGQQEVQV